MPRLKHLLKQPNSAVGLPDKLYCAKCGKSLHAAIQQFQDKFVCPTCKLKLDEAAQATDHAKGTTTSCLDCKGYQRVYCVHPKEAGAHFFCSDFYNDNPAPTLPLKKRMPETSPEDG